MAESLLGFCKQAKDTLFGTLSAMTSIGSKTLPVLAVIPAPKVDIVGSAAWCAQVFGMKPGN